MKIITQKECLKVLDKTPYPRNGNDLRFVQRFMFNLNDLAKKRGYRLFGWTEYIIQEAQIIGSWILSNIEPLSKEIIKNKKASNFQNSTNIHKSQNKKS